MNFKDFDTQMRAFQQSLDQCIPDGTYMVARLDGHGFSKFTKKIGYKKPFDIEFHNLMSHVLQTLMRQSNLQIIYGYTQSDEISLLFAPNEQAFNRKTRKYNSLLAGLASAAASTYLNQIVTFDCRIIPLPDVSRVHDYFIWRRLDAYRNAINGYCYWTSRQEDKMSARQATSILKEKDIAWKYQFLADHDIDINTIPSWQKFGVGMKFHTITKEAYNPITNETGTCLRRELETIDILPSNPDYRQMLSDILRDAQKSK